MVPAHPSRIRTTGAVRSSEVGTETAGAFGLAWEPESEDECTLRNSPPPLTAGIDDGDGLALVVAVLTDEFLRSILLLLPDGAAGGDVAEHSLFPDTEYCVSGPFLDYFQAHGGSPSFGVPISPEFIDAGDGVIRQFFERAVFEREQGSDTVSLALIADRLLQTQGRLR